MKIASLVGAVAKTQHLRILLRIAAIGVICLNGTQVQAAALTPGTVLLPVSAALEPVRGIVVASSSYIINIPGSFLAVLSTDVIRSDASNALGGMTFVYRLENVDSNRPTSVGRLSLTSDSFNDFLIEASYQAGSGIAPASIDHSPSGDVIGFNFFPTPFDPMTGFLGPPLTSARMILQTNAPWYDAGHAFAIDGGVGDAMFLGPGVPEPSTAALGVIALLASSAFLQRLKTA